MTGKADFTEDEWARLKRAPFVAGMAITLADPGGPIEVVKETAAALRVVTEAGERGALVGALAAEAAADAKARHNPLADFKPKGTLAGQEILEEITAVNAIAHRQGDPRGGGGLSRLALGRRARGGERRQGRRLPRLPRGPRQRGRAAHARQARGGAGATHLNEKSAGGGTRTPTPCGTGS